jgi:hypothetical protein
MKLAFTKSRTIRTELSAAIFSLVILLPVFSTVDTFTGDQNLFLFGCTSIDNSEDNSVSEGGREALCSIYSDFVASYLALPSSKKFLQIDTQTPSHSPSGSILRC